MYTQLRIIGGKCTLLTDAMGVNEHPTIIVALVSLGWRNMHLKATKLSYKNSNHMSPPKILSNR